MAWSATTWRTSSTRYGSSGAVPTALTDYIEGRKGYDYAEHGRAGNTHTDFVPGRGGRPVLHPRARSRRTCGGWRSYVTLGVDQFALYLQHDAKESTLAAYGEHIIPVVSGR